MNSGITFCVTYGIRLWETDQLDPKTGAPDGIIWFAPGYEFFTLHEPDLEVGIGTVLIQLSMTHDFRDDPKCSEIWRGYVGRRKVERMKLGWNFAEIQLVTRWENLPVLPQTKAGIRNPQGTSRNITIRGIRHSDKGK
jgi:hypothetical protein